MNRKSADEILQAKGKSRMRSADCSCKRREVTRGETEWIRETPSGGGQGEDGGRTKRGRRGGEEGKGEKLKGCGKMQWHLEVPIQVADKEVH